MQKKSAVLVSNKAEKQIRTLPQHIKEAIYLWVSTVEIFGMAEARKRPGYHDEPLRGDRKGQRSVRLNRAYRLFYEQTENKAEIRILVVEVNKHEY